MCREPERLTFINIFSIEDLSPGTFGVLEPKPNPLMKVVDFSNSICLVPALCYDFRGYRVGYGKGYYDRFLVQYDGYKIGLCYSQEVLRRIPASKFDQRVDAVVTELSVKYFLK